MLMIVLRSDDDRDEVVHSLLNILLNMGLNESMHEVHVHMIWSEYVYTDE